jgi:hypothetical protein
MKWILYTLAAVAVLSVDLASQALARRRKHVGKKL